MFQQFFKPHPALMGLVNTIMIHEVKFDATQSRASFAFPPLPEQGLFFYIKDRMEVWSCSKIMEGRKRADVESNLFEFYKRGIFIYLI